MNLARFKPGYRFLTRCLPRTEILWECESIVLNNGYEDYIICRQIKKKGVRGRHRRNVIYPLKQLNIVPP